MKVYCIISDERAFRSKSPVMFSRVMKKMGLTAEYVPFTVQPQHVGQAMQSLRILNIAGANVTVPYKEVVVSHMDVLSEGANIIGAVNTIVRNGDTLKGYNTNAIGIMDALEDAHFQVEDRSALVVGTGGAAKAVVFILNWLRTKTIYVTGRNEEKAQALVSRFGGEVVSFSKAIEDPLPVHLLVNATSVSSPEESREMVDFSRHLPLPECELVMDLNYGRRNNFWRDLAEDRNMQFMDGLTPLAFQARRTFALWTGMQVPPGEFIEALKG